MLIDAAKKFWEYIDKAQFDKLALVMQADAHVWCPNTREVYKSAESFIEFNKAYPGRWHADVEKSVISNDNEVVNVAKVYNEEISFYCISFFRFKEGKISAITQFWGENSEPPQWRRDKDWAEKY